MKKLACIILTLAAASSMNAVQKISIRHYSLASLMKKQKQWEKHVKSSQTLQSFINQTLDRNLEKKTHFRASLLKTEHMVVVDAASVVLAEPTPDSTKLLLEAFAREGIETFSKK